MKLVTTLAVLLLVACGGTAPTPEPTSTVAPTPLVTPSPTAEPTPEPTPSPTTPPSPTPQPTPSPSPTPEPTLAYDPVKYLAFLVRQEEFRTDALEILSGFDADPSLSEQEEIYEELGERVFEEELWMAGNPADPCYAVSWTLYERALSLMTDGVDEVLAGLRSLDAEQIERGGDLTLDGIARMNESLENEDSC